MVHVAGAAGVYFRPNDSNCPNQNAANRLSALNHRCSLERLAFKREDCAMACLWFVDDREENRTAWLQGFSIPIASATPIKAFAVSQRKLTRLPPGIIES
jgi:hypothetical protein